MKLIRTLLLWTLILGACSPGIVPSRTESTTSPSLTPFDPLDDIDLTQAAPIPKFIATIATPHIDQPPDGNVPTLSTWQQECGYQWAYRDLPELSAQFDRAIKALNPQSTSRVSAFGENCVAHDGQVIKFLAMETDFYVKLSVTDLSDHETFGNWIMQVMQVVNDFPPDLLAGPNPGIVEFRFEKSTTESIGFRVTIQGYNEIAGGKTGEELFRMFYAEP
ncbi:MAG: hypothetical protein C3F07_12885 [Anaerolineales bacterium]|nr:MAG: hypothetical protein C3F07_12885 [Anaerolineales bacterium]